MIRELRNILFFYSHKYPKVLVYMLQNTEYDITAYLKWLWRIQDFRSVIYRRSLQKTKKVLLLLWFVYTGVAIQVAISILLLRNGLISQSITVYFTGFLLLISYPLIWAHLVIAPILLAKYSFLAVYNRILINRSKGIFKNHKGIKIAVAGSYGKTTVKELLSSVLATGLKVAATPGNKNVAVSHARFAQTLNGDEDVVIIEYGEGKKGDIAKFAKNTHPDMGIITGLAPAHLDKYASLHEAGKDIISLSQYISNGKVYVNGDSTELTKFITDKHIVYNKGQVGEAKITNVKTDYSGLSLTLNHKNNKLNLTSGLFGRHLAGTVALAAVIALECGLSKDIVEEAIAMTKPYEHRLELKKLHGAWLIDDTYNGNIDGVKAGTQLLAELPAKRKIYITPGLVDQGTETKDVHVHMGKLIALAKPDLVVLMQNSVTEYIKYGLDESKYEGEIHIEDKPLEFYTNISHILAAGDLVLMQNDWPDNYS